MGGNETFEARRPTVRVVNFGASPAFLSPAQYKELEETLFAGGGTRSGAHLCFGP